MRAYILQEVEMGSYEPTGNVWLMSEKAKKSLANLSYESWRWFETKISPALMAETNKRNSYGNSGTTYMVLSKGVMDVEVREVVKPNFRKEVGTILTRLKIDHVGYDTTTGATSLRDVNPTTFLVLL
ncbi:MAG: hypothetical protein JRN21_09685 [Nitrososphaerota archaeon]|nr:hypothetical protein [Nitrososphaerota archaeon]